MRNTVKKGEENRKDQIPAATLVNKTERNQTSGFVTPTDSAKKRNDIYKAKDVVFVHVFILENPESTEKHQKVNKNDL